MLSDGWCQGSIHAPTDAAIHALANAVATLDAGEHDGATAVRARCERWREAKRPCQNWSDSPKLLETPLARQLPINLAHSLGRV